MRETARQLAWQLEKGNEPVATRAMICRTLGQLRQEEGRAAVLARVDDPEPVVQIEAIRALGRLGHSDDAATLVRLAHAANSINARITAIEALGELKPRDPRVGLSLVDGMEQPDPAIRLASHEALVKLEGKDLGMESKAWRGIFEDRLGRERALRDVARQDASVRSTQFDPRHQTKR
jgi:HEAT repeat protein